ncbi:MAG: His/Gly/Thr/Pro-type tRNA ligase C-terminal domain-containing protein, partial [Nanoarchaeota archaeon]
YRIAQLLKDEGKKSIVKVYVIPIKTQKESLAIVSKLRDAGINSDIDLLDRGISKNLDYADKLGISYVLFVGQQELKQKKVKLRDMKTGKEELLTVEGITRKIK